MHQKGSMLVPASRPPHAQALPTPHVCMPAMRQAGTSWSGGAGRLQYSGCRRIAAAEVSPALLGCCMRRVMCTLRTQQSTARRHNDDAAICCCAAGPGRDGTAAAGHGSPAGAPAVDAHYQSCGAARGGVAVEADQQADNFYKSGWTPQSPPRMNGGRVGLAVHATRWA